MMKPIHGALARAVKSVGAGNYEAPRVGKVNKQLIQDAEAWANWELDKGIEGAISAREVLNACGRLHMLAICGRNKNYDHAADEALLRDFLQVQAAAA